MKSSSECFNTLVYGFGANILTVVVVSIIGVSSKNARCNRRNGPNEKVFLHFLPVFGGCLACADMVMLFKKKLDAGVILYDEWLLQFSWFAIWMTVILSSRLACHCCIFYRKILCFWWMIKIIMEIFYLKSIFPSAEDLEYLERISLVLLDTVFGLHINICWIKGKPPESSSLENPLLDGDKDIENGHRNETDNCKSRCDIFTFGYITSVMKHGVTKQLDIEDLLSLPADMDPLYCFEKLLRCWQLQQNDDCSSPSLLMAICYTYGWPYFRLGVLKAFNDCIGFLGPLLLNKLIRYLEQGSGNIDGYIFAISMGFTSIIKSFLDTQYTFHLSKLKLNLRSSIMTLIYRKCLWMSTSDRSEFSQGEIQTFMSVDADRTVNLCNSLHDMWSLPLQIGVALYLLYTQVKFAFLSGLAITILLIPVNKWISGLIASATEKMMKQKDERIRKTGELLANIRSLKMYAWEYLFADWLTETRNLEVKHLATRKYLDAWCVFFWATTPTLFSLCTFGVFTLMGHELDAAVVFTCLALFNNLISPLNSFPWVINGLIDAYISIGRLSRFLCCFEQNRGFSQDSAIISEDKAIVVHDASYSWSNSGKDDSDLILDHVTLGVPKGSFVAIIGEVGSGKTSLLNSMLGEMRCVHGSAALRGSVAYAAQVPWIMCGTVRENILFGMTYDPKRYAETLRSCALDVDISKMAGGDMSYIGDKGANLSGGQRARLALARAIYHGSDIYLLDDVLSAVDAQVGQWILHNAIHGALIRTKTRVLSSHNIEAIHSANLVVVMERGQAKWMGNPNDMPSSLCLTFALNNDLDTTSNIQNLEGSSIQFTKINEASTMEKDEVHAMTEAEETIELEERKEGRVEPLVYKRYATLSGWPISVLVLFSAILMQASRTGNDLWLSYWVDKTRSGQTRYPTSFFLVVLCIFCMINSFLTLIRAFSFAFGGLRAAIQVHSTLLNKLINAPVRFFDQTPSGRILNRFSSDLYTIDDSLPFILNILLANFIGLLGIAVALSYVQVLFLLLLLPFWYIYIKLQVFYRATSRELRRLDSVSRSPIYASFTETLDGSSTIRAFNSEEYFLARFTQHVTQYQRTSYSETIASQWLSLRLQLLGAAIVSFIAIMAVVGSCGSWPISFGTPGLVGLALSYASPIVSLFGSFLTSFTETEKEMVSVERVVQYMDVAREEDHGCQFLDPNWPLLGLIEFQNVTMKYMPSLPPALKDTTFTIEGGTQIGIIGRTGAGKSSILNALFRLTPICSGRILVDSLNINDVHIRELRSRLAVVPQSPFLFEGALRDNLDPLHSSSDLMIWKILEQCHVRTEVEQAGGLDVHIKETGASFSSGQKQLLCLARALLKASKVLCLDECTANVDTQTTTILHRTIASECRNVTVITVAHRISTVLDMDNILILDHGVLVEQGNPRMLLQDKSSLFSTFARASSM